MEKKIVEFLKNNLFWHSYTGYIDGWIPKFAFFVPIIGYLILFNDSVIDLLGISEITDSGDEPNTTLQRLRFVYFGLILLGVSNIIYKFAKPFTLTIAETQHGYVRQGMSNFSFQDFQDIFESLDDSEKYGLQDGWSKLWNQFLDSEHPEANSLSSFVKADPKLWRDLKVQHEEFLINLLSRGFCNYNNKNSITLLLCLLLSTLGYLCLAWPSLIVFLEIFQSTFF